MFPFSLYKLHCITTFAAESTLVFFENLLPFQALFGQNACFPNVFLYGELHYHKWLKKPFDTLINLSSSPTVFYRLPYYFFFFWGGVRAGMEDIKCALSIIAHQFTWSAKGLNKFIIMVEKTWLYYVSHQEEKQSWFFSLEDEVF